MYILTLISVIIAIIIVVIAIRRMSMRGKIMYAEINTAMEQEMERRNEINRVLAKAIADSEARLESSKQTINL